MALDIKDGNNVSRTLKTSTSGSDLVPHHVIATVTATGTITTQNLVPAGTATAGSAVPVVLDGNGSLAIQVTGTYTGALSLQGTIDGTNWVTFGGTPLLNVGTGASTATIASATVGIFQADVSGMLQCRVTALAAVTGTATVTVIAVNSASMVGLDAPIPTGANTIGAVTGSGNFATTMAASATGAPAKAEDAVHASGDVGVMALGVRYETLTAPCAAGDYSLEQVDDLGKPVIMLYAPPVNQVQGTTAAITGTADTAVIAAGGAGVRNYVTSITVANSSATASVVELKDGSTVIWRGFVPANGNTHAYFPTPLKGTAVTAINVALLTTATNTYVTCTGFRAL